MTNPDSQLKFQELLEAHKGILFKISRAYSRQPEDREDLAQEIVVQLWRSFDRFDLNLRFSTWMYRVALNVAISFLRREGARSRVMVSTEAPLLEVADPREPQSEDLERLYGRIEALDPLDRALLLLYLDGNGQREIGAILGLTETNVSTKLSRLRARLRQEFQEAEHD